MGKEMKVDEMEQVLLRESLALSSSSSSSSSKNNNNNNGEMIYSKRELPLLCLNHVSFVCKSVARSAKFYQQVLGFVLVKRPSSFDFEGAWLFNHGIGIHLLEAENAVPEKKSKINPKDNHISFQCSDMNLIIGQLEEMKIEYVKAVVKEGGIVVDQLFFHDPDGYMVEICNCQNLPVLPLSSCPLRKKMPTPNIDFTTTTSSSFYRKMQCSEEVEEALMMENLAIDMMNFCI